MPKQELLFDLPVISQERPLRLAPIKNRIWTEQKAKLIAKYLQLFVLITKHGVYIDGFAGPQYADKEDSWTARLTLANEPRWLKTFFLCDIGRAQVAALKKLIASQPVKPKRYIELLETDFNKSVHRVLSSGKVGDRVATFCLLDQRTFECDWATVAALAKAKKTEKIEIMYFVPTGWFERAVAGLKRDKVARMEKWWGNSDWKPLLKMNNAARAMAFCEKLKKDLGYKYVTPWPIYERERGIGRIM